MHQIRVELQYGEVKVRMLSWRIKEGDSEAPDRTAPLPHDNWMATLATMN